MNEVGNVQLRNEHLENSSFEYWKFPAIVVLEIKEK